ncbi:hypothetical protein D3C76_357370 [compost metagenome]
MALAQQLIDGRFGFVDPCGVEGGNGDVVRVTLAKQADRRGGVGHRDAPVAVLVAGTGALAGEDADDLERHVANQDVLPQRVAPGVEHLFPHLLADHCHGRRIGFVGLGVEGALDRWPVEDLREPGVVAADIELLAVVAVTHHHLLANHRHDVFDLGQFADGGDVVEGDGAGLLAERCRLAVEVEDVRAECRHLRHDLTLAAFADGQHDHHRGHPDDNAEQRQCGAKAVDPHHPPGRLQGFEQFTLPCPAQGRAAVQALAQVVGLQPLVGVDGGMLGGRIADDQAITDFDDPLRPRRHFAVVGDQDDYMALAGQFVEQRHDFGAAVAVERAGGFVGEDDVAAVHQRPGN